MSENKNRENMRCLILGGGGFIGSHIADRLIGIGCHVRIFERPRVLPYRKFFKNEKVEWIAGDFQSMADIESSVKETDVIFHLISTTLPKNSNDDLVYDVESNLIGTIKLLNAAIKNNIRKVLFISSGGTVYGTPKEIPISESHPTNPLVSYGICKLAIEKYLNFFYSKYGLEYSVLRVSNPFGARQRIDTAQGAVKVFLHKAIAGEVIDVWGNGDIVRDYIYIEDVVDAFIKALDYTGEYKIFNIGMGQGISINDLIKAIETLLHKKVEKRYLPGRDFDVPVNVLDTRRAREILGWNPRYSFQDGLAITLKSMQDQNTDP
jgi:UDP-glucose 4-epimerase